MVVNDIFSEHLYACMLSHLPPREATKKYYFNNLVKAGRSRLTLSRTVSKPPLVTILEAAMSYNKLQYSKLQRTAFKLRFQFQLAPLHKGVSFTVWRGVGEWDEEWFRRGRDAAKFSHVEIGVSRRIQTLLVGRCRLNIRNPR
jgi:hypothetical protein